MRPGVLKVYDLVYSYLQGQGGLRTDTGDHLHRLTC